MIRLSVCLTVVSVLPLVWAAQLGIPPIEHHEQCQVVTTTSGGDSRWQASWSIEQTTVENRSVTRFLENGQGHYHPFRAEVRWTTEALWTSGESFSPLQSERKFTDLNGNLLITERKVFDRTKGTVSFERFSPAGRPLVKELRVPADTLILEGLGTALRALPFDAQKPLRLHLLTNEPQLYEVTLRILGAEEIETPAGQFNTYKVEMKPEVGVIGLFGFLVPKLHFWFFRDLPHFWTRYEGLEAGRGSPQVVMELSDRQLVQH